MFPFWKELKPNGPARRPHPMPCLEDWDFWRFLVSALGLIWDVLKSTVFK